MLHLKLGWAWILLFSIVGLVLEGLHGLEAGVYLDVGKQPRRIDDSRAQSEAR